MSVCVIIEIMGLSPRVRGNPFTPISSPCMTGSIPACAGEPGGRIRSHKTKGVYPRVCGGTASEKRGSHAGQGLSPRVRGNLGVRLEEVGDVGSIPACAGEPACKRRSARRRRVYPRVCGGTTPLSLAMVGDEGLSPRVRGNLAMRRSATAPSGSIPACAGEPQLHKVGHGVRWVYPRVCGGTANLLLKVAGGLGLSPRVRGNLSAFHLPAQARGSIPACAGEPHPLT